MKPFLIGGVLVALAGGFAAGWFGRGMRTAVPTAALAPDGHTAPSSATADSTLSMVDAIMRGGGNEVEMPFPKVVEVASGHRLLAARPDDPVHNKLLDLIANSLDATLAEMNAENSPVKGLRRINEASAFFEDGLRRRIDEHPEFECGVPHAANGKLQRSGYPDLRLHHPASGKTFYLDPKLYEESSRTSTLRTFYFTSDPGTVKIAEDAAHWLVGIHHDGADGNWKFTGWDLVDLARLKVKLKAEFQASNRDLYSEALILRSSAGESSAP
jgi:hypothetical protein